MHNNTSQQEPKIIKFNLELSTRNYGAESSERQLEIKINTLNFWMGEAFDCIQLLNELVTAQEIDKPIDGILDLLGRIGLALSQEHEITFRHLSVRKGGE